MANRQRYYHEVFDLDSAKEAIKQLTDHVYELRNQMDEHTTRLTAHSAMHAALNKRLNDKGEKPFTTDVCGIKINATTDPLGLQNGYTIRYNSATGQFNFGT